MKKIKNFLFEAFDLSSITHGNDPDRVVHDNRFLTWSNRYARAFIYSKKNDDFLISEKGETHSDIISGEDAELLKEFGLNNIEDLVELRFISGDDYIHDKKEWKKKFKENNKLFKIGRVWVIPKDKWDNEEDLVYVAWWNELTSSQFNTLNKKILDFLEEFFGETYNQCIFIDNNGTTKFFDKRNANVKVKKASAKRKEELKIARCIHLASQKAKKDFFKLFIKNRDEKNQEIYNHTKSKTEAEYRSIKYQENKNNDNMKSLKQYLTEMAHAHKEKRTRLVMTPWGEYTGEEEEYEEYIVDKCDQQDWADFLRGKDKLGDNLKNLKFSKIGKEKHWNYSYGDEESEWKDKEFTSMTIRWKDTSTDIGDSWNEEMYAKQGSDDTLAKELFKDIEAYRTGKIEKDDFVSKWEVSYKDGANKNEMPSLDMNVKNIESGKKITVHMNALLS